MGIAIQATSEGLREAAHHSGGVALCRLRLPLPQSGNRLPRRGSITRFRGIILVCEECGEKTILDGPLSVWSSNTAFCGCECGKRLTATDRIDRKGPGEVCGVTNAASPFSSPYP